MMRTVLAMALVPLALGDYSYSFTDAPTAAPTAETMSPTASMAPTRTETYAPTRMTEAPSYAPTTDTYAPTMAPTVTRAPTTSFAPTVTRTLSPVKQIEFFSVSTDSTGQAAAATLYNIAANGTHVEFPNDPSCSSACTATGSHSTCNGLSASGTQQLDHTTPPVILTFSGIVSGAPGGCCTANSCAWGYIDGEPATFTSGGKFSFNFIALGGGDWYEVTVAVYRESDRSNPSAVPISGTVKVYRGSTTGSTPVVDEVTVSASAGSDDYFIRFFSASYDASGGTVLGARLEVNSFGVNYFSARRRLIAEGDHAIDRSPWFQKALAADQTGVVQILRDIWGY